VNEGKESTMIASKETLNGARMNAQVKLRVISLKRLELGSDADSFGMKINILLCEAS
jgi:hypothetical protein